jgi:hypothetical protein
MVDEDVLTRKKAGERKTSLERQYCGVSAEREANERGKGGE